MIFLKKYFVVFIPRPGSQREGAYHWEEQEQCNGSVHVRTTEPMWMRPITFDDGKDRWNSFGKASGWGACGFCEGAPDTEWLEEILKTAPGSFCLKAIWLLLWKQRSFKSIWHGAFRYESQSFGDDALLQYIWNCFQSSAFGGYCLARSEGRYIRMQHH